MRHVIIIIMNLFSSAKKTIKKVKLILDISSNSVSGCIFEADSGNNTKLLYVAREQIAFKKVRTSENLLTSMLRSLNLVLIHLEKYGLAHLNHTSMFHYHIDSVAGILSSPWFISETKTLELSLEEPFVVTKKLVDELIDKEERDFMDRFATKDGHDKFRLELFEHKIIQIRLNGYATVNPYGKKARELQLRIFASIALKHILNKIRVMTSRYFPEQHLEFHTFSLAAFASIRDFIPETENFLVVQVGGEVTDITIVKNAIIADSVSFPLGYNNLLRALDKICGNHPECTLEALLKLHRETKNTTEDKKRVAKAIADAKVAWLELFNNAISNFSAGTFLPKTVFLFENGLYTSLFKEFLKSAESSQFTISVEPFNIKTIEEFGNIFKGPDQSFPLEVVLAMEANFTSRFGNSR